MYHPQHCAGRSSSSTSASSSVPWRCYYWSSATATYPHDSFSTNRIPSTTHTHPHQPTTHDTYLLHASHPCTFPYVLQLSRLRKSSPRHPSVQLLYSSQDGPRPFE